MNFVKGSSGCGKTAKPGGLTGWLLERFRGMSRPAPRLTLLERISLAPRQSLSLVEAEGRRFLIATSADGAPAFYPLHPQTATARTEWTRQKPGFRRVS